MKVKLFLYHQIYARNNWISAALSEEVPSGPGAAEDASRGAAGTEVRAGLPRSFFVSYSLCLCLSVFCFISLSLSIYLSVRLSIHLPICLSV